MSVNNSLTIITSNDNIKRISNDLLEATFSVSAQGTGGWSGSACAIDVSDYITDNDNIYILSAEHVFDEKIGIDVYELIQSNGNITSIENNTLYSNYLISRDRKHDLVLFRIPKTSFVTIPNTLKIAINAQLGETVLNCGYTLGDDNHSLVISSLRELSYLSSGKIINNPGPSLMTSASETAGGNSGGPTINLQGKLLGIASWGYNPLVYNNGTYDTTTNEYKYGTFSIPYYVIRNYLEYTFNNQTTLSNNSKHVQGKIIDETNEIQIYYYLRKPSVLNSNLRKLSNNINGFIYTSTKIKNSVYSQLNLQTTSVKDILVTSLSLDNVTWYLVGETLGQSNEILSKIWYSNNNSIFMRVNVVDTNRTLYENQTIEITNLVEQDSSTLELFTDKYTHKLIINDDNNQVKISY